MKRDITFEAAPLWESIDQVRDRFSALFDEIALPGDDADALIMIVSELLENAIKYGSSDPADIIIVTCSIDEFIVIITAKNHFLPEKGENLARLDRTIQWIRGYQNPFDAYITRLRAVAGMDVEAAESALGLVRIAYEGQAVLDFFLDEQGWATVSAVYTLR